jgi:hypothetical protein
MQADDLLDSQIAQLVSHPLRSWAPEPKLPGWEGRGIRREDLEIGIFGRWACLRCTELWQPCTVCMLSSLVVPAISISFPPRIWA